MTHDGARDRHGSEAAIWAEGHRRREAIRGLLERHPGRLAACEVCDVARALGVSRATLYRLIGLYRRFGSVEALLPKPTGRRRGTRVLPGELETIIHATIQETYGSRPTLTDLVEQIHARCRAGNLPRPHRRTIRARLATAAQRGPGDPSARDGAPG